MFIKSVNGIWNVSILTNKVGVNKLLAVLSQCTSLESWGWCCLKWRSSTLSLIKPLDIKTQSFILGFSSLIFCAFCFVIHNWESICHHIIAVIDALPWSSRSFPSIVYLDFCHVNFFHPLTPSWWGFSAHLAHSDMHCLLSLCLFILQKHLFLQRFLQKFPVTPWKTHPVD